MSYVDVRYDDRFSKPDQFCLTEPLRIRFQGAGDWLIIPRGFVSDGASVPRFLWWLFPPVDNRTLRAYIVHDYLYEHWEDVVRQLPLLAGLSNPRYFADGRMYELSEEGDSKLWLRNKLYYKAVRWFGNRNWEKFRKRNVCSRI